MHDSSSSSVSLAEAEAVWSLVPSDPSHALERALAVLEGEPPDRARAILLRAAGVAARTVRTIDESNALLSEASEAAYRSGDPTLQAEVLLSQSGSLALAGRLDEATAVLSLVDGLDPPESVAALSRFQLATILARSGRASEAERAFGEALPLLERSGQSQYTALAYNNRGRLRLELGRLAPARSDLETAYVRHTEAGHRIAAAGCLHNLGELALYEGDLARALQDLGRSRDELADTTSTPWELEVSRCEALLAAGLFRECAEVAAATAELMDEAGFDLDAPEALLLASRARRALGELDAASDVAAEAERRFEEQGRDRWARRARLERLRSLPDLDDPTIATEVTAVADRFASAGDNVSAWIARVEAIRRWLLCGDTANASAQLSTLDKASTGRPDHVALHSHAVAMVRAATGNRRGALAALRSAVAKHQRHRLSLAASDLLLAGAEHLEASHRLAADLVVQGSSAPTVFRYVEVGRATTLKASPVRPPRDPELIELTGRVRSLMRRIDSGADAGVVEAARELRRLRGRLVDLERRRESATGSTRQLVSLDEARGLTPPDGCIASLFWARGRLCGQRITPTRTTLHDLGPADEWTAAFRSVRETLMLASRGFNVPDEEFDRSVEAIDKRLDRLLSSARRTVVVPPAELLDAPWSLLPRLAERAHSVTPSVSLLSRPASGRAESVRLAAFAGPGLRWAEAEVAAIAAAHGHDDAVVSETARTDEVLDLLPTCRIAHFACHGTHRAGNALLSSLLLTDGPLLVADLTEIQAMPRLVVLSACHGADTDRFGSETAGLVSTLLRAGAHTVVAGVGELDDSAHTVELMRRFHTDVAAGARPSEALASARQTAPRVIAGTFSVFGSDASLAQPVT